MEKQLLMKEVFMHFKMSKMMKKAASIVKEDSLDSILKMVKDNGELFK